MNFNTEIVYTIVLLFVVSLSSFIHSGTGFGFSIFAMTILSFIFPLTTAATLCRLALLVITITVVINLWKHINWHFIIIPVIFSLIGNTIGLYILMTVNADFLSKVLGGVLVILGIYMFKFNGRIKIKKSTWAGVLFGLLSGVLGGLFNLAGVVMVVYFLSALDDKLEYASSLQANFLINSIYINIVSLFAGSFSAPGMITYSIATVAAVLVGSWFGLKLLKKINKDTIGKLSYSYMIIMGIIMAIK